MPGTVIIAVALALLLCGLAFALLRPRRARPRRRTNHTYIPACYNQPPAPDDNHKSEIEARARRLSRAPKS